MNKKKLSAVIGLILINFTLFAQSDCSIYRKVVDTIYRRVNISLYNPSQQYPVDPITPKIDTNSLSERNETPHFLYIQSFVTQLQQSDVRYWFADQIGSKGLRKMIFVKSKYKDLRPCSFDAEEYCYKFVDSLQDREVYDKLEYCDKNKKNLKPQSITLSNILYSKNNNLALLRADLVADFSAIRSMRWLVLMELRNGEWQVKKIQGSTK
ncbi:MAG: hypothetical protein WC756_15480 [Taibaiella sp.]|jgi:hypothetical protein